MEYSSCHIIKHGLCFFNNMLTSCCFSPVDQINGQIPPLVYGNYKGEILSKEELFKTIHKYTDMFKNGICPKECKNCYHIESKEWDEDDYIDYITITHFSNCNADCIYCSNNVEILDRTNNIYKILPVLRSFKEQGIIRKDCELHIGGGEFTIYTECNELLDEFALSGFARVFVPTNAIVYSDSLFNAMNNPASTTVIIVSLDSGSRNMYKKVKRVDKFDKVIENLVKYASTEESRSKIRLKYIILPTVNDNINEFKKFLKIAKRLGISTVIIDIDARYSRMKNFKIDNYFINLAEKMNEIAIKEKFNTEFYSFFCHDNMVKNGDNLRKLGKSSPLFFEKMKFNYFNKDINKIKELYINRKYG